MKENYIINDYIIIIGARKGIRSMEINKTVIKSNVILPKFWESSNTDSEWLKRRENAITDCILTTLNVNDDE